METWRLGHRPALDGLRGIAVALVLLEHGGVIPSPAGAVGVTIFFALSGFLITRLIIEARDEGRWSYRRFLAARVVRLAPALVIAVAATSALWVASGRNPGPMAVYAAAALLYVQNLAHPWLHDTVLVHTWSLAVEEQFYAVWPFALPFVLRARSPLRVLGASVALRLAGAPWPMETLTFVGPLTNAYALLVGCALAIYAPRLPAIPRPLAVAAMAGVVPLALLGGHVPVAETAALVFTLPAVVVAAVLIADSGRGASLLTVAPLRFLGRISYAAYLWHWPLLYLTQGAASLATIAVSLIIATASTLLLEEPLRAAWRRDRVRVARTTGTMIRR